MANQRIGMPARLGALQDLRALAVMLVILVHAINVVDYRFDHAIDPDRGYLSHPRFFNEFGASGVDLFFVISGFVMALLIDRSPGQGAFAFLRNRLLRIVAPYWIASLAYAGLAFGLAQPITGASILAAFTIIPYTLHTYTSPVLTVGWSLAFELSFYAWVALSMRAGCYRLPVLTTIVTVLALLSAFRPAPPGIFAVIANPIQLEFLWGILAFLLYRSVPRMSAIYFAAPLAILGGSLLLAVSAIHGYPFAAQYMAVVSGETGLQRALLWGLPWTAVLVGHVLLARDSTRSPGAFHCIVRLVGDASYSLYLTHLGVCLAVTQLVQSVLLPADMLILEIVLISLLLGVACHIWIERPLLDWLKGFSANREHFRNSSPQPATTASLR